MFWDQGNAAFCGIFSVGHGHPAVLRGNARAASGTATAVGHLCNLVLTFLWKGSAHLPRKLQHNLACHQAEERKLGAEGSALKILCGTSYLHHDSEKEK